MNKSSRFYLTLALFSIIISMIVLFYSITDKILIYNSMVESESNLPKFSVERIFFIEGSNLEIDFIASNPNYIFPITIPSVTVDVYSSSSNPIPISSGRIPELYLLPRATKLVKFSDETPFVLRNHWSDWSNEGRYAFEVHITVPYVKNYLTGVVHVVKGICQVTVEDPMVEDLKILSEFCRFKRLPTQY